MEIYLGELDSGDPLDSLFQATSLHSLKHWPVYVTSLQSVPFCQTFKMEHRTAVLCSSMLLPHLRLHTGRGGRIGTALVLRVRDRGFKRWSSQTNDL